jgi:hypothetical protein
MKDFTIFILYLVGFRKKIISFINTRLLNVCLYPTLDLALLPPFQGTLLGYRSISIKTFPLAAVKKEG